MAPQITAHPTVLGPFSAPWTSAASGRRSQPGRCRVSGTNRRTATPPRWNRGWIDHIHSWSNEPTPAYSLVANAKHSFPAVGEGTIPLDIHGRVYHGFEGFELRASLS